MEKRTKAPTRKGRPKKQPTGPASAHKRSNAGLLIVGVGASAGGLEAYQALLKHLPIDTGMAFVLVQHLDREHESALVHLLARETEMPVCEVTNDLLVEPNNVYVIPPNTKMGISDGELKLTPRGRDIGPARSIDFFFESLAEDKGERAVGVVLSGTATDGTNGLEAIKAASGITFAQDASAKFDSMPRSAVAAGCVDFVLPPEEIAAELARIALHPYVSNAAGKVDSSELRAEAERESNQSDSKDAPLASGGEGSQRTGARRIRFGKNESGEKSNPEEADFKKILLTLRNHCGVDFTLYKSSTIRRRVMRRVILNKHQTLAEYSAFLKDDAKERDALYSDVLIGVTSFFRNAEAFQALRDKVFPQLLEHRQQDQPVRIWVLGCSTGQEAYSLAMTFAESIDDVPGAPKLQIFATDLNEAMLEKARAGFYAKSLAEDITPERLRRFFVEQEGGYRVCKPLREQVVFARQNVLSDPPFSRMDLITCRNLLIYLEPELQKRILPAFHYALKSNGFLFLGASESIGQFTELFEPADAKQKIFTRKLAKTPSFRSPSFPSGGVQPMQGSRGKDPAESLEMGLNGELSAQREADRISVSQFCPPSVLVDGAGQVVQFRGATGAYLEPPRGKASFDVLKMARDSLVLPLRAAFAKAKRDHASVQSDVVQLKTMEGLVSIKLHVIPLRNLKEQYFLVCFDEARAGRVDVGDPGPSPRPAGKRSEAKHIATLERDLADTRDYLQSIQERNDAVTEELQASGEEMQSSNEELQSINEELETSKEELESAHEELTTMNDEMAGRNAELGQLNADLNNLYRSIRTSILVLGCDLTIRRFTMPAEKLFNLSASDVGRPLAAIRHSVDAPGLESLLAEVIDTISVRECEVRDKAGSWYALRAHPYLTLDKKIDGVVLVLNDITAFKRSEAELMASRNYAEATLRTLPVPFLILQEDLRVATASAAFCETFQVTPAETQGSMIYELGNGQWDIPKLREALETILPQQDSFTGFLVEHDFESIGHRTMILHGRKLKTEPKAPVRILLAIEDISERHEAMKEIERASRAKDDFLATLSHELRTPLTPVLMITSMQQSNPELPPKLQDVFAMIRRNIDLEARLIDDLLDLTRINRGKLQIEPVIANVHELLSQTAETVGSEEGEHAQIVFDMAASSHYAMADPVRLQQVFWNLIKNALKFTPANGTVALGTRNDEAGNILVSVKDTGIGIAADLMPHIFNAFEQGAVAGRPRYGGLGLGLAISKSIVEAHDGTIWAASEGAGSGTTFTVTLATIDTPEAAPSSANTQDSPASRTLRLLLVEDDEATSDVFGEMLRGYGHHVIVAATVLDALAAFSSEHFDAVISDIGLPDGNGIDLMREIQRQRAVPAVALSGYGRAEDIRRSMDVGFFAHLVKPIDIDQLLSVLERIHDRI